MENQGIIITVLESNRDPKAKRLITLWMIGCDRKGTVGSFKQTATTPATAPATTLDHDRSIHCVINIFAFGSRLLSSFSLFHSPILQENR